MPSHDGIIKSKFKGWWVGENTTSKIIESRYGCRVRAYIETNGYNIPDGTDVAVEVYDWDMLDPDDRIGKDRTNSNSSYELFKGKFKNNKAIIPIGFNPSVTQSMKQTQCIYDGLKHEWYDSEIDHDNKLFFLVKAKVNGKDIQQKLPASRDDYLKAKQPTYLRIDCTNYVNGYISGSGINTVLVNNGRNARDYHGNGIHAGLQGHEIIKYEYINSEDKKIKNEFRVPNVKWDGAFLSGDGVDFEHPACNSNEQLVVWDPNHPLHVRTNHPEGGIFIHLGVNSEGCIVLGAGQDPNRLYNLIRTVYQNEYGKITLTTRTVDNITRLDYTNRSLI